MSPVSIDRFARLTVLAILVLLGAHPADAQDRLFIGTGQIGAGDHGRTLDESWLATCPPCESH